MRAVFKSFDNFMAVFIAALGVAWSTAFMPLLGGPLHTYETRAIGLGWQSLRTGEAATITEALEIASSFPAEAVFPSAHAQELPPQVASVEAEPELELLGGPEVDLPPRMARQSAPRATASVRPVSSEPMIAIEPLATPLCDVPAMKRGLCDARQLSGEAGVAGT